MELVPGDRGGAIVGVDHRAAHTAVLASPRHLVSIFQKKIVHDAARFGSKGWEVNGIFFLVVFF